MPHFKIILTSDYEVWGNGSGCVERCVIDPSEEMMSIAEKYGAPITFFFDVCEYWAFLEIEKLGKFENDYKPASLMKDQLQKAVKKGHDVQLHFHPQWLSYNFISNQKWELDNRYWRIPEVASFHSDDWSLDKLFKRGVETLKDIFEGIKSDYKVKVFRAGAWSIQPEAKVIEAMVNNGIEIDSTVAPGISFNDGQTSYDFSEAESLLPNWKCNDNLTTSSKHGDITEFPISTIRLSLYRRLLFLSLKLFLRIPKKVEKCSFEDSFNGVNRSGLIKSLSKVFTSKYKMLNFSDATSSQEMIYICKQLKKKYQNSGLNEIPIVAISHPKTFANSKEFDQFASWISEQDAFSFGTFHN